MKFKFVDVKVMSVFDYVKMIKASDGSVIGYRVKRNLMYYSPRYNKNIKVFTGDVSDGATCAPDINSFGWLFHDELCATGKFADGSECTNLQASAVLSDIMSEEGRWFRRVTWFTATWLFGGGRARKNGMW